MSLIKQLWIAIAAITLISLGGSLVVSALSARHYLEQQLSVKNIDNANSLALSLSQMEKDPVTVELLIAAQFDTGHYRLIRLADPNGKTLIERVYADTEAGTPAWLPRLVPLDARPAIAQVQDGWRQFGTLTVESHGRYAYESLWNTSLQLLLWFIAGGALCGLAGTALLKWITRPLRSMVEQAEAIGGGRFVTTPEPRTMEFRAVVRSMNTLSERVRGMLEDESRRLEELRRQTQYDEPTGLFNRSQFLNQLDAALAREDAQAGGAFVMVRLHGLAELNQRLGRARADALLHALADRLRHVAAQHAEADCGRLNASDFAILTTGGKDAAIVAAAVDKALGDLLAEPALNSRLLIAAADYAPGENRSHLLARVDGALAAAAESGEERIQCAQAVTALGAGLTLDAWRRELDTALDENRLRLERFAVIGRDGQLLHHEVPVRLMLHGSWQNAGRVLPCAARLGMVTAIDARVVRAAVNCLESEPDSRLAINLSAEALCDKGFRDALHDILRARPLLASRLWIEVQELSALRHQVEFRALCLALRPLGSKIGLEHAGRHFSRFAELHDLGVDYLKISAAFVRGIDASSGNQAFVRGLCTIAHSIGMIAIAEGVGSEAERNCLMALGVDGVTGPGVR